MQDEPGKYLDDTIVRVPWPDEQPLPAPGRMLSVVLIEHERPVRHDICVLVARPDWESGWIQVRIAPAA